MYQTWSAPSLQSSGEKTQWAAAAAAAAVSFNVLFILLVAYKYVFYGSAMWTRWLFSQKNARLKVARQTPALTRHGFSYTHTWYRWPNVLLVVQAVGGTWRGSGWIPPRLSTGIHPQGGRNHRNPISGQFSELSGLSNTIFHLVKGVWSGILDQTRMMTHCDISKGWITVFDVE